MRGVTKECRHRDQKVGEQRLRLPAVLAQNRQVLGHRGRALQLHPPRDAPANRRLLVVRKVVTRANAQMREDALHRLPVGLIEEVRRRIPPGADQFGKPFGDLPHGQDEIGVSGRDRAARH
jgi:hypothetical protein